MIMDHKNKDHAERTEDVLFCIIVAGIIIFVGGLGILHVLDLEWIAQGAPCFIYSLTGWYCPGCGRHTSSKGASLWQAGLTVFIIIRQYHISPHGQLYFCVGKVFTICQKDVLEASNIEAGIYGQRYYCFFLILS